MVLPKVGTAWQAGHLDISMMASLVGKQRWEADWKEVVAGAGLSVRSVEVYEATIGIFSYYPASPRPVIVLLTGNHLNSGLFLPRIAVLKRHL